MGEARWIDVCVPALVGLAGWLFLAMINQPPPTRAEVIDWAQALGSIAAVGVAAWVGLLPSRHLALAQRQANLDFILAVQDAADSLANEITPLVATAAAGRPDQLVQALAMGATRDFGFAMSKLLNEDLRSWPSIRLFSEASKYMAACRSLAAMAMEGDMRDLGLAQLILLASGRGQDVLAREDILRKAIADAKQPYLR